MNSPAAPVANTDPLCLPAGSRVLVTGASGFIGGRLVERLLETPAVQIRCTVRGKKRASRLAKLPVDIVYADLSSAEDVSSCVRGVQYIFNCAYDSNRPHHNIIHLNNIVDASKGADQARLIHVSSFAVYQPFRGHVIDEATCSGDLPNPYVRTKLKLEEIVLEAARSGKLPGTIIQPTIVYGPFGETWTDVPARQLLSGEVILPNEGKGKCNAVFVDDVVDGLILSAISPLAIGERFVISGESTVTWRHFYEAIAKELNAPMPIFATLQNIEDQQLLRARWGESENQLFAMLERIMRSNKVDHLLMAARAWLPPTFHRPLDRVRRRLRQGLRSKRHLPTKHILELYSSSAVASNRKAEAALGYLPRVSFEEGIALTGAYLRQTYGTKD